MKVEIRISVSGDKTPMIPSQTSVNLSSYGIQAFDTEASDSLAKGPNPFDHEYKSKNYAGLAFITQAVCRFLSHSLIKQHPFT